MTTFSHLRKTAKALNFLQPSKHNVCTGLRQFLRNESSFVPKRVLIVGKLSRYYFEKLREPTLTESQLKRKLQERGSNYEDMLASHIETLNVQQQVIDLLKQKNIDYRVVNRQNLNESSFSWADLILPIGGDGTFLLASNLIFDDKKPIIGINSNPERSEGYLLLPPKYTKRIPDIFQMLESGNYQILMRRRIRTTLQGDDIWGTPFHTHEKGRIIAAEKFHTQNSEKPTSKNLPKERRLPWLALNEVFIAETLSARTSDLLIKLNDSEKYHTVRSSGLCVSTGTGSTSWFKSINCVNPQIVQEIIDASGETKKFSNEEIQRICTSFNDTLRFHAEELKLCYSVRDMIVTDIWPLPKCLNPRGFCKKVTVRSQCFDAGLVLDGGIAVPFNFGVTVVLEMYPEDSLRTLVLSD